MINTSDPLELLATRIIFAGFRALSSLPYASSCPVIAGVVPLVICAWCPFASFAR